MTVVDPIDLLPSLTLVSDPLLLVSLPGEFSSIPEVDTPSRSGSTGRPSVGSLMGLEWEKRGRSENGPGGDRFGSVFGPTSSYRSSGPASGRDYLWVP